MKFFKRVKSIDHGIPKESGNLKSSVSSPGIQTLKNWYSDRYEWLIVQRNILFVILLLAVVSIVILTLSISFIKSTTSIEPFVIEIDPKTGVPTVVDPIDAKVYYASDAIKRFFVWKFIKTREEYYNTTFERAYKEVGLMSSDEVYGQYRRAFNTGNPQSPFNLYGEYSYRVIELKSMIFQDEKTAQIRIRITVNGNKSATFDKIIYIQFKFENLELNEDQRYVNPLGFIVTLYRIEDEKI